MAEKKFTVCKSCEVVSDTEHLTEEKIQQVCEQECVTKWAYILHDHDTHEDGTPKNPHYHVYLKFSGARQVKYIAQWFGLAENFIHRIRTDERNTLSYLCHHTDTSIEKYQYDPGAVKASFDYPAFLVSADKAADKAAEKVGSLSPAFLQELGKKLDSGEIAEYNIRDIIPDNYTLAKNKVIIDNMIKYANDKRGKEARRMLNMGKGMKVIWLFGRSGMGKSHYVSDWCERNKQVCYWCSNSTDLLGEYKGEPVVCIDDIRGSDMRFSQLLKLLDPNVQTAQKSRYKDKYLYCHTLFITSPVAPENVYKWYKTDDSNEAEGSELNAVNQLMRRIFQVMEFKEDCISEYAVYKKEHGNTYKYECMLMFTNSGNDYADQSLLGVKGTEAAFRERWFRERYEETGDIKYLDALRGQCGKSLCTEEINDDEELPL